MQGAVEVSCQVLKGTNKAGILRKNEKGYYDMIVGALNMVNNKGEYYDAAYGRKFFDQGSDLVRMAEKGILRGEEGHPKQGMMDDEKFVERLLTVEEKSACCHHRKLWLDFDNFRDATGRPFIGIMSSVGPSGYYGEALERDLENPEIDVNFSIRCFSMPRRQGGRIVKEMKHAVTFDHVSEPGILQATKYHTPSLEDYSTKLFTQGRVMQAARNIRKAPGSNESSRMGMETLLGAIGWEVRDTPQAKRNFMELLNTTKL